MRAWREEDEPTFKHRTWETQEYPNSKMAALKREPKQKGSQTEFKTCIQIPLPICI